MSQLLVRHLRTFEFFRGVEDHSLAELAAQAIWKVYPADAVIFWEGDLGTNLFYMQYGWLKIIKTGPDGREQVLRFLGPGEIFNEVGVFARKPNPATAIALEETGIWRIPRQALEQVLLRYPQMAFQVIESMAVRVIGLVELTADLSLRPVEARLAKLLLEQAGGKEVISRRRWATLGEMASHLGTVPDVLSRAMKTLTQAGLLEIDRQEIRLLNPSGLAERAHLDPEEKKP